MYSEFSQLERIAVLESRVSRLETRLDSIDNKLDQIIAFRNKGAGIFWLISAISGTGMIGAMTWLVTAVRGH